MKDLLGIMKQAQELQKKMEEAQSRLEATEVVGEAGAGLVTVTLNAKGEAKKIDIDPTILVASEKEVVEDLFIAAHADARRKIADIQAEVMKEATGGMPMPPGFSIPG